MTTKPSITASKKPAVKAPKGNGLGREQSAALRIQKELANERLLEAEKQLGKVEVVVVGDKKPAAAKPVAVKPEPPVQKITVLKRECPHAEGSNRAASWAALLGSKDSREYAAKGGAHKYLARWASKGLITLA